MVPGDTRSPFITSGLRLGSPALTTRGFTADDFIKIAHWIAQLLREPENTGLPATIRKQIVEMAMSYPLFQEKA
jgi:glycine hydroxymethyltransferase